MYISYTGLKAIHDRQIQEALDRAELKRKMSQQQGRTVPAAWHLRQIGLTLGALTGALRRVIARA